MTQFCDRIWLWGQNAGSHHTRNNQYQLPGVNRMTPREGLEYFGISRCCRVVMANLPEPPFDAESEDLAQADEVVWSVIGSGGSTRTNQEGWTEVDEVIRQAKMYSNVTGVIMDDFFSETRRQLFPPSRIQALKDRIQAGLGRSLPLWVVWYERELDSPVDVYFPMCDVITFWTWYGEHLFDDLPRNLDRVIERTPGKRRLAGCYLYDYGNRRPLSLEAMQHQCEVYKDYMDRGLLDGVIICSNCCADIGLETADWMREWIRNCE